MGIISVDSPDQILHLNRKQRNKLTKGKSSTPINHLILQEGVPTNHIIDECASEEVIYNVNGISIGGFYRVHPKKSDRDILNSTGMSFKSLCQNQNELCHDNNTNICGAQQPISKTSKVLSKLANIAAQQEFSNE